MPFQEIYLNSDLNTLLDVRNRFHCLKILALSTLCSFPFSYFTPSFTLGIFKSELYLKCQKANVIFVRV